MSTGNMFAGFVYGFVSAFLMAMGSWFLWASGRPAARQKADAIRDLSHFGRPVRKHRHHRRPR